jgi:hypothetical protein
MTENDLESSGRALGHSVDQAQDCNWRAEYLCDEDGQEWVEHFTGYVVKETDDAQYPNRTRYLLRQVASWHSGLLSLVGDAKRGLHGLERRALLLIPR